jgi:hypothetical protein
MSWVQALKDTGILDVLLWIGQASLFTSVVSVIAAGLLRMRDLVPLMCGWRIIDEAKEIKMESEKEWRAVLPWPGRRAFLESMVTYATLAGADFQYVAVAAWDYDEAWVIDLGDDKIIASSNKGICAIGYLKHLKLYNDIMANRQTLWSRLWAKRKSIRQP